MAAVSSVVPSPLAPQSATLMTGPVLGLAPAPPRAFSRAAISTVLGSPPPAGVAAFDCDTKAAGVSCRDALLSPPPQPATNAAAARGARYLMFIKWLLWTRDTFAAVW